VVEQVLLEALAKQLSIDKEVEWSRGICEVERGALLLFILFVLVL
jgi:hypothetical protein